MQLLSTFYKGFSFLLCVIDIFSKCVWVLSWVDHGSEFYKNSLKHLLNEMTQKCIQHIVKENLLFLKDY